MINLNHWALDEFKQEIRDIQLHELLQKYIEVHTDYTEACQNFVKSFGSDTRSYWESRCRHLQGKVFVVSLKISEKMTGVGY